MTYGIGAALCNGSRLAPSILAKVHCPVFSHHRGTSLQSVTDGQVVTINPTKPIGYPYVLISVLELPSQFGSSAVARLPSISTLHLGEALGTFGSNGPLRRLASWHRCPALIGDVLAALPRISLDQRVQFLDLVVGALELGDADRGQIFDHGVLRHFFGVCIRGTAGDRPARRKHDYGQRDGADDGAPCERLDLVLRHLYFLS